MSNGTNSIQAEKEKDNFALWGQSMCHHITLPYNMSERKTPQGANMR